MNHFSITSEGSKTFLVYSVQQDDEIDSVQLSMLTANSIEGLVPIQFRQHNLQKSFYYDITSKIALSKVFSGVVNRNRLLGAFSCVAKVLASVDDYMLDRSSILLNQDMVYFDITTNEAALICLPLSNVCETQTPETFFKEIMFKTQFDQSENCDYVAAIINHLNARPVLNIDEFSQMLRNLVKQSVLTKSTVGCDAYVESNAQVVPVAQPIAEQRTSPPASIRQMPKKKAVDYPLGEVSIPSPPNALKHEPVKKTPPVENFSHSELPEGEQMSFLYLLAHYSKENAAKYKQQSKKGKQPEKTEKTPKKGKNKKGSSQPTGSGGFAIPGMDDDESVASVRVNEGRQYAEPAHEASILLDPASAPGISLAPATDNHSFASAHSIERMNFGDTLYFGSDNEDSGTMILGMESEAVQLNPHLVRMKNNERILLNKSEFRIGRDQDFNDYSLSDNRYVGGSHCCVYTRNGEYFIQDNNTKNHTYVDGRPIPPGQDVKLSHGQKVMLANEEFEFRIY